MTLTLTGDTIAITLPAHSEDHKFKVASKRRLDGNWKEVEVWDSVDEQLYRCQALVFDEPSQYGINGGRVSKLSIHKMLGGRKSKEILWYERGFSNAQDEVAFLVAAFIVNHYDQR